MRRTSAAAAARIASVNGGVEPGGSGSNQGASSSARAEAEGLGDAEPRREEAKRTVGRACAPVGAPEETGAAQQASTSARSVTATRAPRAISSRPEQNARGCRDVDAVGPSKRTRRSGRPPRVLRALALTLSPSPSRDRGATAWARTRLWRAREERRRTNERLPTLATDLTGE